MKRFLFAFILIILGVTCLLFGACDCSCSGNAEGDDSYIEEGVITAGGEDVGTVVGKKQILNAEDIHVAITATKDSITSKAYILENNIKHYAEIDLSAVTFGTKGTYDINYIYGEEKVAKKLYVYDLPTISGDSAITVKYSQATTHILNNLTAKDCFDNAIDMQVLSSENMLDKDGSFNVGTFNAVIIAIDKAGQSARFERAITITAEQNPIIEAGYTFDVNDNSVTVELSREDSDMFVGLSIDGTIVSSDYITVEDNKYIVSNQFFYDYLLNKTLVADLVNGDEHSLSVLTVLGKARAEMLVTDNQLIVYDDDALENFVTEQYECGQDIKIPKFTLLNKYQNVTPVYTMIDKNGVRTPLEGNTFNFNKDGAWKIEINLRGKIYTMQFSTFINLGLQSGAIYGGNNLFTATLPQGFTLKQYKVTLQGKPEETVLNCTDTQDLPTFISAVHNLNTRNLYDMKVIAEKEGEIYSQTAMFGVVKNGFSVLNSDMSLREGANASFAYVNNLVGARKGVYSYAPHADGSSGADNNFVEFSKDVTSKLAKDWYLTFDVYYTSALTLNLSFGGRNVYLRAPYIFYKDKTTHDTATGDNPKNTVNAFCLDILNVYDYNGNLIDLTQTEKKKKIENGEVVKDDNGEDVYVTVFKNQIATNYKNQWLTIEIKIDAFDENKSAGFFYDVGLQQTYISNVRVSSTSQMADATVNPVIPADNNTDFEDIWK